MPKKKTQPAPVGKTIKQWREGKGMTQEQAAQHFGWTRQQQGQLESASTNLMLGTVDYVHDMTGGEVTRLDWPRMPRPPNAHRK
jgi:transcriptional regulator with XRE-family HTH domain